MAYPYHRIIKPRLGSLPNRGHRLSRGLVGLWLMNENTGTTVHDLSGNGNDGSLVADTHWAPGKFGDALDLDGAGDYVNCGQNPTLNITGHITISVWVYRKGTTPSNLVGILGSIQPPWDANWALFVNGDNSNIGFIGWGLSDNAVSGGLVPLNTWVHVVAKYDGSYLYIYTNGTEVAKDASTGSVTALENDLLIGTYVNTTRNWNGLIDHAMIYNRALSASEIALLYREPFAMFRRESGFWVPSGEPPVGTNMKINIGDTWKDVESIKINIGDTWKDVSEVKQNIGDTWKTVF